MATFKRLRYDEDTEPQETNEEPRYRSFTGTQDTALDNQASSYVSRLDPPQNYTKPEVDNRSLWERTVDFITSRRLEASLAAAEGVAASKLGLWRTIEDVGYQSGVIVSPEEKKKMGLEDGETPSYIQNLDKKISSLQESQQKHMENAEAGLGDFGKRLVGAGAQITEQVLDEIAARALSFGLLDGNSSKLARKAVGYMPFASRVFGGAAQEAKDAGANIWQQISSGAAQTANELIWEEAFGIATPFKLSHGGSADDIVEALIDRTAARLPEGAARTAAKLSMTGGAAAISEFLEELGGSVTEWATQMKRIYGGDPGTWQEAISSGFDQGLTAGLSALFGASAGAVTERVGQNMQYNKQYRDAEYRKEYGAAIAAEAAELNPDSRYAAKQNASAEAGKTLKGYDVNKLFEMNEDALRSADVDALRSATEARLTELGETGDVSKIASGIAKTVAGKSTDVFGNKVSAADALRTFGGVSLSEQAAIRNSQYGWQVLNELQNGGMEWTGRIETERLNPEVYGRLLEKAQVERTPTFDEVLNGLKNPGSARPMNTASLNNTAENPTPAVQTVQNTAEAPQNAPKAAATATPAATGNVTEQPTASIDELSAQYGKQAEAFRRTYNDGQDVEQYAAAYRQMFDYGKSQFNYDYASGVESVSYLTDDQKRIAWETGRAAGQDANAAKNARNASMKSGKTGRRKGAVVAGEGVSYENFNRQQKRGYRILSKIAEATGLDIVLYSSQADENGKYPRIQGEYDSKKPDRVRIDINSGLMNAEDATQLGKYAMVRTFTHEFTHTIERFSPDLYDELRGAVWEAIGSEYADSLVVKAMSEQQDLTYNQASREVVAEALTDILPDSKFVNNLAQKHQNLFQRLLSELKDFLSDIRDYFSEIGWNSYGGAQALKREADGAVRYVESIVEIFDRAAENAVETFQSIYGVEEQAEAEAKGQEQEEAEAEEADTAKVAETEATVNEPAVENEEAAEEAATAEETASEPASTEAPATAEKQGEETTENPEKTVDTAPETPTMEEGPNYTVRNSTKYGSTEVSFDGVPSEAVRNALKARKFKWNGKRKVWYGKSSVDEIQNLLDSLYGKTAEKGESENGGVLQEPGVRGEEARSDNERPVLQPEPAGEGAARLLDEGEAGNVPGAGGQGDAEQGSGSGSEQDRRAGSGADTADRAGGRDGSGESGDLRRESGLTEESAEAEEEAERAEEPESEPDGGADTLRTEVADQIEQQSTVVPKGTNYVIGESLNLPSGEKARFSANVEAIRLIRKLNDAGRYATAEEQEILSRYVGWGGLPNAFGTPKYNYQTRKMELIPKNGWEAEFRQLRGLVDDGTITEEEYKSMSESTVNAHYTSVEVIKAMYDGLRQLGFTGGRMLEPSSGVGNFVGGMPESMSGSVKSWTMVELDRITGQIAKYLYPQADVRIQGFENAVIPNNYMDVAIGNVPFGNYAVVDKSYPGRVTKAIHNYFFAKSLDKVRPGGIVMFITSSFTMDAKESAIRQYIMDRADLLGAIRLPNTAFSGNAGTKVVTDILVLKKRAPGTEYAGAQFLNTNRVQVNGKSRTFAAADISEYFLNHPEMVLGTPYAENGMYGRDSVTYDPFTDRGSLGDQIREAFRNISGKMEYPSNPTPESSNFKTARKMKQPKRGSYFERDGKIVQNTEDGTVELASDKKLVERISGIIGIRDAFRELATYLQQGQKAEYIKAARDKLNTLYDSFVEKYGYLSTAENKKAFRDDPDSFMILSLENYDPKTKTATKADIFTKDTISPNRTITHVDDVLSGVIVSMNRKGEIDAKYISELTGKTEEAVTRELIDSRMAFKNQDGSLEAPETYLSGNVRAKLRAAEALVPYDSDFQNNVDELEKIIPQDITFDKISVALGAQWVPDIVYRDFISHMLGWGNVYYQRVAVARTNTGEWRVELTKEGKRYISGNVRNSQTWGTKRKSFLDLIKASMQNSIVTIYDDGDDGNRVVNAIETEAARNKVKEIEAEFQKWLWSDETRRKELQQLYNDTYNALVTPKYSGENLTINGLNPTYTMRPHQADAVQRIISSGGNTLLAHKVGAGKTLEMAAAAMKLRELGIVSKPVFAVPKTLVAQWGSEFQSYFPTAKLLVADDESFQAANRKVFENKIANGDWDAVILSYEQFEKIPLSNEYQAQFVQEQIDEALDAIAEARAESGNDFTIKQMEKTVKSLKAKLQKLQQKPKDDAVSFEELGIDSLFVDEAHSFKNLQYTSKLNNVSGLGDKDGSERAFDLYTKTRYLQKLNGGRGIVFATATPVMNSMVEMYTMQRYLQSDLLNQLGLKTFDAWAKQFGDVVTEMELDPTGARYRMKEKFSRFRNLPELQQMLRSFSDVLTQVPGLKIPKRRGGKEIKIICKPGEFQKAYIRSLVKRAENAKNVNPSVDNMLKITSDGRKISYTQRMIDPSLPYEPGCKVMKCVDYVFEEWKNSTENRGTQIVFLDAATPKGRAKKKAAEETDTDAQSARLYDDIKAFLIEKGIPANEIAFIHDAKTDAAKKRLFDDMNEGKVRVLIGSTGKMGVGMNAQKRVVAIHHLDAPWRPGDLEQRDGRAFRQGNMNDEVAEYIYTTEGSFDARLWGILESKQGFISQIMNGDSVGRTVEDTGDTVLSFAEIKAETSGNPLILEQYKLSSEIRNLLYLKSAHKSEIARAQAERLSLYKALKATEISIENTKQDIQKRKAEYSDENFKIKITNRTFTSKKDAAAVLLDAVTSKVNGEKAVKIGDFCGFPFYIQESDGEYRGFIAGKETHSFKVYTSMPSMTIKSMVEAVGGMEEYSEKAGRRVERLKESLSELNDVVSKPFQKEEELSRKQARYNEIMTLLGVGTDEQIIGDDEDEGAQYQIRRSDYSDSEKRRNSIWLQNAEPVGHYTGEEIGDRSIPLKTRIDTFFKSLGNNVSSEQFGDVSLGSSSARSEIRHGSTALKIETYAAIPDVIKNGRVIFSGMKGNNGPERIVVAAPVTIGPTEKKCYVGVMLQRDPQNQRLYLHDAVQKEESAEIGTEHLSTTGPDTKNGGLYTTDILLNALNVKNDFSMDEETDEQYQQRTSPMTDREILSIAGSRVDTKNLTPGEIDALRIFNERAEKLNDLTARRQEEGQRYREQQFGKNVNREEAQKTLNRMKILDDQIKRASDALLQVEQAEVMRRVLQQARKVVTKEERAHGKELLNRYRDRTKNAAAIKKYRERIQKDVKDLSSWLLHPGNKDINKHVPEALRETVIRFLTDIDFTSKRQLRGGEATKADEAFAKSLDRLAAVLRPDASPEAAYLQYQLPEDFVKQITDMANEVRALTGSMGGADLVINRMSAEELQGLSKIVRILKSTLIQMNRLHQNAIFAHADTAAQSTTTHLNGMTSAKRDGALDKFVMWDNMRPAYAFERFGEGGKSIFYEFTNGYGTYARLTKQLKDFAKDAYTTEEVKSWESEEKTFEIGGEKVSMPVSYLMSLYCLKDRKQALQHLLGGGLRVATHKNGKTKNVDFGHRITKEEIDTMVDIGLTPRQKEVARTLQQYMATVGSEWGNYVSFARWGENAFGDDPNYFPINSDGKLLPSNADENPANASLYALLNMSFTKELNEKANNRLMLYSIFDVFANHMASMAQYRSFALPVLDSLKWLNYGSVREEMTRVYGQPEEKKPGSGAKGYAESFVINFIRAFNGTEAQGSPTDSTAINAMHRYNMAQIAYNVRVVAQQPLSIVRAGTVLDTRSILEGLKMSPAQQKKNIEDMLEHSGIALWKDLGFYDVNISHNLTDIIKHKETFMDKVNEVGMFGAELADKVTWGAMWNACKKQVTRKTGLKDGEAFYEAVNRLFDEVIYKTQVVDTIATKPEFLRSKGFFARAVGSFMSEPVTTASMVINAFERYTADMRRGMSRSEAWRRNGGMIVRTAGVYAVSSILLASVTAVIDALRDDDDYETLPQKWLEAFGGNLLDELNPLNKLPIFRDLYELSKSLLEKLGFDTYGNEPRSILFQWSDYLLKGTEILMDKLNGVQTNYTWYAVIYKYLQAASGASGLPAAAATRTVVNIWNNTVGTFAPSLKLKTYRMKTESEIKYALQDGYLSPDAAYQAYIDAGLEAAEAQKNVDTVTRYQSFTAGNKRLSGISEAAAYSYYSKPDGFSMYGSPEDEGIPKETYYHAWRDLKSYTGDDNDGDGKNDTYSKLDKQLAYIESLSLTKRQKYALANALTSAAEKTILKRANFH